MFPKDTKSLPSQAATVAVEVAAGPAALVAVGVTPTLNARGLFLWPTLTRSLLSKTSITLKKCMPSLLRPRRPSTGSSGTQGRNAAPVLPVAGSPAVSAISALSDTTKRANEEGTDDGPTDQSNRDNPALAHQQTKTTKPN